MKKVISYFVQGLIFIAPIGVTTYVVYLVFKFIDNLLKNIYRSGVANKYSGGESFDCVDSYHTAGFPGAINYCKNL